MIKKLLLFIKLILKDFREKKPDRPYGITCYVGLPGTGKTLSMVEELNRLKVKFPKAWIYTNFGYKGETGALTNWKQLVELDNGVYGILYGLDEAQDMFDRNDWKNMPKPILGVFAQNRKAAKKIICTSQAYEDLVVDIRRRCHFIIECWNICNRWVFQRAFAPGDYKQFDGVIHDRKRAWKYNFIATDEIYNAYDSYKLIENIMFETVDCSGKTTFAQKMD
jgi:hypothetical protein